MDHLIKKNNFNLNIKKYDDINSAGGGWSLQNDHVEAWAWVSQAFSDNEINAICNMGQNLNLQKASVVGDIDGVRDSYVSFVFPNDNTFWLFDKLKFIINDMNNKYFGFDLTSMDQGLQYTEYSNPGSHYSWHIDKGVGIRKLSLSLQLSDPDEYEGGDLELWFGGDDPVKIKKEKGMITFFPSYVMHRVTPVTKGTRKSLVCWISGPPFK
jgi:PKHD-type hydroxylase